MWKQNHILLNNQQIKEKNQTEMKKYLRQMKVKMKTQFSKIYGMQPRQFKEGGLYWYKSILRNKKNLK